MTNTTSKLKIAGLLLVMLLIASLGIFTLTTSAATADSSVTVATFEEATDVYWYVHNDKLLLSAEQGSSGFYKWSKESIAAVNNAAGVPWNSSRDAIKSVIIYSPIAPPSTAFWFQDTNLTSFSATVDGTLYLDMRYVTDAQRMFAGCSSLTELDLSFVSAPLVTNIESVFDGCSAIKELDISCFDGAPISNMMNAFYGCAQLESLDVSGLDISRVTDFAGVFWGCAALKSLDLSNLDGRNITTLENAFNGCSSLTTLTFGENFTGEKVTDMTSTFRQCKSLVSLDLSGFSTTRVTSMQGTFASCETLEELTLGDGFTCVKVTDMGSMFANCKALESIDTSGWGASGVTNTRHMFSGCTSLANLDLSGLQGAKPLDITFMFSGASSLKGIDLSVLDTSGATSLYNLFSGCSSLESFDLSSIDTSEVTNMERVFSGCTSLSSFSFVGVNTSKVESMAGMFDGCTKLVSVDMTGIDTGKVKGMSYMFGQCSMLERLDMSDFDVAEGLSATGFVRNCFKLNTIVAPKSIPASVSLSLSPFTYYTGQEEITSLTNEHQNSTVVRKFEIGYRWKNGTKTTAYTFEPSYYYYGYGATISAVVSENGYAFGGWTRSGSDAVVTEITATDTGDVVLYAKLTPYQPIAPVISVSDDVSVVYGEGFSVSVDFAQQELHTYTVEWYRTPANSNSAGWSVSELRNTRGFTVDPKWFPYGIEIETKTYFYCEVTAKRTDNGLTKTVKSAPIMVYVERAQATITTHPTAIPGLVYDGTPQVVATPAESDWGYVVYGYSPTSGFTQSDNKRTNAGVGILYYYVSDGTYYKGTEMYTLEYTIEPADATVLWGTESLTVDYTGEPAIVDLPSVLLLGSDTYTGEITYSYTGTSSGTGLPVEAGTYSVIASIPAEGNYKAASSQALTLTINKTAPALEAEPSPIEGLVYSGQEQVLVNPGAALGGVVEYSFDQENWSADLALGKNAGEYTVYYRIKGDDNHFDGAVGSLSVSIGRKNITVIADDQVICVDGTYTLTHRVEGLVGGDQLPVEVTLNTQATVGKAGEYEITITGAATSDNYSIAYESGALTVREHAYTGAVTTTPSCNAPGETTYTCAHDSTHTYTEPIPVDESAHAWDEGVVTTQPTCTAVGTKTFTCAHNSEHVRTEDVAIDESAHAWDEGVVTTQPTCTAVGTKTFTCAHNSEHTKTEDVAIDESAHAWDEGVITTNPTCTAVGTKTYTCAHDGEHTKTEDIAALGHEYDHDCDSDCNVCADTRTPAEHVDANKDHVCDVCSAELPKDAFPVGAIVGIAIGAVAVIGLGGFALFWFVIRKKRSAAV